MKNRIFRGLALLLSLLMLLTSAVQGTYGLIVTQSNRLTNTFSPTEQALNTLWIRKTVEHPLGAGYVIPEQITFDFQLELGNFYANTILQTTVGEITTDANGSVTVSIHPGSSFGIEGIDTGTKVTVTEVQKEGSGFAAKDGAATQEITVAEEGNMLLEFVNVYTPAVVQPLQVTVGGTKTLSGRDWQEDDAFSFILEQKIGEDTWMLLGRKTVAYNAADPSFNVFDFSDLVQGLTFDAIGNYTFRIREEAGTLENIIYDQAVHFFTIHVTDTDMDGKLEIGKVSALQNTVIIEENETYRITASFGNIYASPEVTDPEPPKSPYTGGFEWSFLLILLIPNFLLYIKKKDC